MTMSNSEGLPESCLRELVVVSGRSGAGKSSALHIFEDLGFETVDNLPLSLFPALVYPSERATAVMEAAVPPALAVGVDIRTRDFDAASLQALLDRLAGDRGLSVRLLFLECESDVLLRRYTETRRRHPLSRDRALRDGLAQEAEVLAPVRALADEVVDTTDLGIWDLKRLIRARFSPRRSREMEITVLSFSYRNGLPREADLVFDVRFLKNPHYKMALRKRTGQDEKVAAYVREDPAFSSFMEGLTGWLEPLLPRYRAEGKSYLTVAFGCTGGRHRSVFLAEVLADWLKKKNFEVCLVHRELSRRRMEEKTEKTK